MKMWNGLSREAQGLNRIGVSSPECSASSGSLLFSASRGAAWVYLGEMGVLGCYPCVDSFQLEPRTRLKRECHFRFFIVDGLPVSGCV